MFQIFMISELINFPDLNGNLTNIYNETWGLSVYQGRRRMVNDRDL